MTTITNKQAEEWIAGCWPADSLDDLRDDLEQFLAAEAEAEDELGDEE